MDKNVRLLGVAAGVRLLGAAMMYPFLSLYFKNVAGLGYALIGALILLVSILPLAVSPFGGLICDRLGRKRVFVPALAGEAASVLLVALSMRSGYVPGVLLGGALAGVTGAVAGPAVQAYVADMTDVPQRTMAYMWVRIGFNAGFTVGVALGGVLITVIGFADTAFVTMGILLASVAIILLFLDPSPYDVALSKGQPAPGHPPVTLNESSMRGSLVMLAKDRKFLVLCMATFFSSLVYGHWSTTFVLFSNTILLVPYIVLALALALNGVIVIFGQLPMTKWMTGKRHTYAAVLANVMMGLAFLALGGISLYTGLALAAVFSFVVLLTIGENLGSIPAMTLASNVAPPTEIGNYNGVFGLFSGLGNSLSPLFGGIVLAYVSNSLLVWTILAIPVIPSILLFQWLGSRMEARANTV